MLRRRKPVRGAWTAERLCSEAGVLFRVFLRSTGHTGRGRRWQEPSWAVAGPLRFQRLACCHPARRIPGTAGSRLTAMLPGATPPGTERLEAPLKACYRVQPNLLRPPLGDDLVGEQVLAASCGQPVIVPDRRTSRPSTAPTSSDAPAYSRPSVRPYEHGPTRYLHPEDPALASNAARTAPEQAAMAPQKPAHPVPQAGPP